jgi:predicted HAD superfamily Cof-like phosphohydrolase
MAELQIVTDIKAFHKAGEAPILTTAQIPPAEREALRIKLIEEEVGETLTAMRERNLVEIADGLADSIVVLVGTALEYGIDLTAVWNEVHRSNMAKFPECTNCAGTGVVSELLEHDRHCHSCNGRGTQLLRREDGKILKPPGWTPPDIKKLL